MAKVDVPAEVEFATKPALARTMITRASDAGVPAGWVAGDEVQGADPQLRAELQQRKIGYVLAVASNHRVTTPAGTATATELAVYRAYAPRPVTLAVLAHVAGRRWTMEESFQTGKELAGLDEHHGLIPLTSTRSGGY
jgi:SRSO17 transposase